MKMLINTLKKKKTRLSYDSEIIIVVWCGGNQKTQDDVDVQIVGGGDMPRSRQNYFPRCSLTLVDQEIPEVANT